VVNDFRSVRGRDQIVAELSEARERMIYSAVVERCEKVDESTLLLRGQARYAVDLAGARVPDGGASESSVRTVQQRWAGSSGARNNPAGSC
jgi:hypothetical protein